MKIILILILFILPFHAFLVTYLKCSLWINTDFLRFWKEIIVVLLLFWTLIEVFLIKKNTLKIFHKNYLLLFVLWYALVSLVYVFYPKWISVSSVLAIKYDLFFLFCLIVWLYLSFFIDKLETIIKTLFFSWITILIIFFSVYLFWDIKSFSSNLWYSQEVSTYKANSCIAFSQNITWWIHRFQWSFWDPIRMWVYFVMVFFLSLGVFLDKYISKRNIIIFLIVSFFIIMGIYFSYTKTTLIWLLFWWLLFVFYVLKYRFNLVISKKIYLLSFLGLLVFLSSFVFLKKEYFLHTWSLWERSQNLIITYNMLKDNMFWYGMWISWPASQLWTSENEKLSSWVKKFLPENWYLQVFLEVWIVWFLLFMSIIFYLIFRLYIIMNDKKDYISISIFVTFLTILLMWNLTHIFEERATSYILFLIIGIYIQKNWFFR